MGLREIGIFYVFIVGLIFVALRRGSLPEAFDMAFSELFAFFFVVITVSVGAVAFVVWATRRKPG